MQIVLGIKAFWKYSGRGLNLSASLAFSINLRFTPTELEEVTKAFPDALRTIQSRLEDSRPSLFLVLDDIDALAELPDFANWLKSTVDTIALHRSPTRVAILLVGLEETRRSLLSLQPSLARVFQVIDIFSLDAGRIREFLYDIFWFSKRFHRFRRSRVNGRNDWWSSCSGARDWGRGISGN